MVHVLSVRREDGACICNAPVRAPVPSPRSDKTVDVCPRDCRRRLLKSKSCPRGPAQSTAGCTGPHTGPIKVSLPSSCVSPYVGMGLEPESTGNQEGSETLHHG